METLSFSADPTARQTYLEGMCHVLALAISRRTGWPMLALRGTEGGENTVAHVCVEYGHDTSLGLDVRGLMPLSEMMDSHDNVDDLWSEPIDEDELLAIIEDECLLVAYTDEDIEEADRLAEILVARVSDTDLGIGDDEFFADEEDEYVPGDEDAPLGFTWVPDEEIYAGMLAE
jgi:hypothetical protein